MKKFSGEGAMDGTVDGRVARVMVFKVIRIAEKYSLARKVFFPQQITGIQSNTFLQTKVKCKFRQCVYDVQNNSHCTI